MYLKLKIESDSGRKGVGREGKGGRERKEGQEKEREREKARERILQINLNNVCQHS